MRFLSYFSIKLPVYLVYMAQQVEYEPDKLLAWLRRLPDLSTVMHRKTLVRTNKAAALSSFIYAGTLVYVAVIGVLIARLGKPALLLVLLIPLLDVLLLVLAIYAGRLLTWPANRRKINSSRNLFSSHQAVKIAIMGSYGKTTMKELLLTVLGSAKNVSATPGNKNVPISHARWAQRLKGDEDALLIEFGESKPGDIEAFCRNTSPDIAIVTGIAPNHLDRYKTFDTLVEDFASVGEFVAGKDIYVNADAEKLLSYMEPQSINTFDKSGTGGIKVKDVRLSLKGMDFTTVVGGKNLKLHTGLVGRHLLGPLSVCILLANELGLSGKQITEAIKHTKPFEHRLQPSELNGAWVIDDTYNGSLEGFRAGLALLKELSAKRKIYVTPGLVDQGEETENVHREIGLLIADSKPDKVVLMNNSTTDYIKQSMESGGYKGKLEVVDDPLEFYTNLDHTLAAGDVVLLQNDWTDNYY